MIKTIKYQLDLNRTQRNILEGFFGCSRFIYNYMLQLKIDSYKSDDKVSLTGFQLCKKITELKKIPEYSWLKKVPIVVLQQSIRNLDTAYQNFFSGKMGFPKFKSKRKTKQSCKFIGSIYVDSVDKKIKLPKIGWVRIYMDRDIPHGKIGVVTVTKNSANKYFVSINVKNDELYPPKCIIDHTTSIGIDVGIKDFVVLSTGEKVKNPKYLESCEKRLKILQRRLSRKLKGSNRSKVARLKVAKHHYKITCKRSDFLHKLSSKIIRENQTIIIEDLNVIGLLKNHTIAKSISSASWSEFFRQLKYKSEYNGNNFIEVGRFEPTSKSCSVCNRVNDALKLSDRYWACMNCGTHHDRDINAATNIKNIGLNTREVIPSEDVELLALAKAVKRQDRINILYSIK